MATREEIGWVAGIIDGEGSIVMVRTSTVRKSDGQKGISCRILLAVCDLEIIKKYTEILSDLGVYYRYVRQDKFVKDGAKYSRPNPVVQVYIAKMDSIVRLLEIISPHLTLKKNAANHVLEFAKWMISNSKKMQYCRGKDYDYLRDESLEYWNKYRSEFVGKARSHSRSIMEAVLDPSTPIHWPE